MEIAKGENQQPLSAPLVWEGSKAIPEENLRAGPLGPSPGSSHGTQGCTVWSERTKGKSPDPSSVTPLSLLPLCSQAGDTRML